MKFIQKKAKSLNNSYFSIILPYIPIFILMFMFFSYGDAFLLSSSWEDILWIDIFPVLIAIFFIAFIFNFQRTKARFELEKRNGLSIFFSAIFFHPYLLL